MGALNSGKTVGGSRTNSYYVPPGNGSVIPANTIIQYNEIGNKLIPLKTMLKNVTNLFLSVGVLPTLTLE